MLVQLPHLVASQITKSCGLHFKMATMANLSYLLWSGFVQAAASVHVGEHAHLFKRIYISDVLNLPLSLSPLFSALSLSRALSPIRAPTMQQERI